VKQYLLFDLDGTLTDPKVGITTSVQYALSSLGIEVENPDDLCCFIGPPLTVSFAEYYGLNPEQVQAAILKYRERFSVTGLYENEIYPGIGEMLAALQTAGKTLLVATSKPQKFAELILEHFRIRQYFTFVGGSGLDGSRDTKAEVIAYVLAQCGIADVNQAVMIGDRKHDVLGAKEHGMETVGVLFGYGDRAELEQAGAEWIAADVGELQTLLLGDLGVKCQEKTDNFLEKDFRGRGRAERE